MVGSMIFFNKKNIPYELERILAKRKLKKLIIEVKEFCTDNRIGQYKTENNLKYNLMLSEIVYLWRQFLPWGRFFYVESYGFSYCTSKLTEINKELTDMGAGKLNEVLAVDLRDGRYSQKYREGFPLWMDQKPYKEDFFGPDARKWETVDTKKKDKGLKRKKKNKSKKRGKI